MQNRLTFLITSILSILALGSVQVIQAQQSSSRIGKFNSSVGPFELHSADSGSSISLQFAGQLRMALGSYENDPDTKRTNELQMTARRIRLTVKGTIYNPGFSYKLHLSTAPKSLELIDFYFDYNFKEYLRFRFGQYKTPFTRYRIQSFQKLAFADWAIVTKYFGAERQMGLSLHNGYEKMACWGYIFGVFSGYNARASHAIGLSNVYGEETVNPSDLSNPGKTGTFHPELFFHMSYITNNMKIDSNSDADRTALRYSLGFSTAWDLDPSDYNDFSLRIAPELLIKYYGLSIISIGYAGYAGFEDSPKIKIAMTGGLFQTAYRFSSNYEISLRYALVDFDSRLTDDARQRALLIIENSGDDPNIISQYGKAGLILKEQELSLGFNIYIIENSLKYQNDFGWLRHTRKEYNIDDFLWRSQFQLTF